MDKEALSTCANIAGKVEFGQRCNKPLLAVHWAVGCRTYGLRADPASSVRRRVDFIRQNLCPALCNPNETRVHLNKTFSRATSVLKTLAPGLVLRVYIEVVFVERHPNSRRFSASAWSTELNTLLTPNGGFYLLRTSP